MVVDGKMGIKDRDAKTRIPYYSISPPEVSAQTKFITAIMLLNDQNKPVETFTGSSGANGSAARSNLPKIEKLEGKDMIGVRINQDGRITDIYLNLLADGRLMHRNSNNMFDGWETDAYIFAVTYPGKASSAVPDDAISATPDNAIEYFISNGSYLRKDHRVILNSLYKVFMVAKSDDVPELILQGQPVMHAGLLLRGKASQLRLNGQVVKPVYEPDHKTLIIDISEKTPTNE
jgi:hypothetical protein